MSAQAKQNNFRMAVEGKLASLDGPGSLRWSLVSHGLHPNPPWCVPTLEMRFP